MSCHFPLFIFILNKLTQLHDLKRKHFKMLAFSVSATFNLSTFRTTFAQEQNA